MGTIVEKVLPDKKGNWLIGAIAGCICNGTDGFCTDGSRYYYCFPNVKVVMIHMGHGHGVYIDAAIKMAKRYPNIFYGRSVIFLHDL